jgi:hypothetical protein
MFRCHVRIKNNPSTKVKCTEWWLTLDFCPAINGTVFSPDVGFHVGFYQIKSLLYEGPLVVFVFLY